MSRIVVITGSGRGIGHQTAITLAARGYTVAAHYGSSRAGAESLSEQVNDGGGRAFPFGSRFDPEAGDPSPAFWSAYTAAAEENGIADANRIYGFVNNAGTTIQGGVDTLEFDQYQQQMYLNAAVPHFLIAGAAQRLVDGGRIVNISSQVAADPDPGLAGYAMSKRAVEALTVAAARMLGARGITVNAVAPSLTATDMTRDFLDASPDFVAAATARTPLGRLAEPSDIAGVVAMLLSDDASWITGQVIQATGGA